VKVIADIRKIVAGYPLVEHVNEVLTMHMGPKYILVNLSVDFQDKITASELEDNIARLDEQIKQVCLNVKRVFIEAEARKSMRIETVE
jgi:divalent metal cation (Fe/Co/Zn/Cd) transporter